MNKSWAADIMEHEEEARRAPLFDASARIWGHKRLWEQPFNPFMPTQEEVSNVKERKQQQQPPPLENTLFPQLSITYVL